MTPTITIDGETITADMIKSVEHHAETVQIQQRQWDCASYEPEPTGDVTTIIHLKDGRTLRYYGNGDAT